MAMVGTMKDLGCTYIGWVLANPHQNNIVKHILKVFWDTAGIESMCITSQAYNLGPGRA